MPLRAVACLLTMTVLAGCSEDDTPDDRDARGSDGTSMSPSASDSSAPTESGKPSSSGDFTQIEIVHATQGGGASQPAPVPLTTDAEVEDFVADLSDELAGDVRDAVDSASGVPDSHVVAGQIVGIGCQVPTSVQWADGSFDPIYSKGPEVECAAPVTSIAIVSIDSDLL